MLPFPLFNSFCTRSPISNSQTHRRGAADGAAALHSGALTYTASQHRYLTIHATNVVRAHRQPATVNVDPLAADPAGSADYDMDGAADLLVCHGAVRHLHVRVAGSDVQPREQRARLHRLLAAAVRRPVPLRPGRHDGVGPLLTRHRVSGRVLHGRPGDGRRVVGVGCRVLHVSRRDGGGLLSEVRRHRLNVRGEAVDIDVGRHCRTQLMWLRGVV